MGSKRGISGVVCSAIASHTVITRSSGRLWRSRKSLAQVEGDALERREGHRDPPAAACQRGVDEAADVAARRRVDVEVERVRRAHTARHAGDTEGGAPAIRRVSSSHAMTS
jgi:hypothetical protein